MSFSVAISADTSRITLFLDQLRDAVSNAEQGLLESVDRVVIPDLYDASTTVWNVRTGRYSSSWYSQIIAPNAVRIGNDAPYSMPLEWGWTLKNGSAMPSPGVLFPTVYSDLELLVGDLVEWIQSQIAG